MAKSTTRHFEQVLPLYNLEYDLFVAQSIDEAKVSAEKFFKGLDIGHMISGDTGAFACSLTREDGCSGYVILLNVGLEEPEILLSVASHEALHISWYMCQKLGIELDPDNHEAQTYIQHTIFQVCKEAMEVYIKNRRLKIKL